MTTKRGFAISGLLMAVVLSASCGGQPFPKTQAPRPSGSKAVTPTTPQARLLAAVQRATDAKTSRLSFNMTVSGFGSDLTVRVSGAGVIDLARQQMMMTLAGEGAASSVSIEMRIVDHTIYVNKGDGWTSVPFSATSTDAPNPSSYLDYLQGVSNDVKVEGHDILRGAATTRYGATLDLARALTRVRTSAQRSLLKQAVGLLGNVKMPVTVWIDGLGRLRKMQMSMDLGAVAARLGAPSGTDPKIGMTIELYDFGVPVDVQVPPGAKRGVDVVTQDRAAESDLRNALTAEKVRYTDTSSYTEDASILKPIEPSLDWGGKLTVVVGDGTAGPATVVCLSERSASGANLALADAAALGTYYSRSGCPSVVNESTISALGSSW